MIQAEKHDAQTSPQIERALDGLRVIDFGQYIAGPLLSLMLADQGAEVIRIDPPSGPRWQDPANAVLQRGKKSICLDLKTSEDNRIARDLISSADIVVENFRPGVMARLSLDYATCRRINPRLVYISLPGFGQDDPRASMRGWEGIVSAASGLHSPYPAQRKDIPGAGIAPSVSAVPIASNFAAFMGACSIIAALIARERDGVGQWVELPLFNASFEALIVEGQRGPPPTQNSFHAAADNRFLCADGRWGQLLLIAPRHLKWFVRRFLPHLAEEGLDEISLVRGDEAAGRRLVEAMRALFATRPAAEWDISINRAGVPFAVCQTIDHFLLRDSQARAAQTIIELKDPELGPTSQLGYPVGLSLTQPHASGPRRLLNADRTSILADLAARPKPETSADSVMTGRRPPLAGVRIVDMAQVLAAPAGTRILAQFGADIIKVNPPSNWLIGHLHFNSGKKTILLDVAAPEGRNALFDLLADADIFVQNLRTETAIRLGLDEPRLREAFPDIVYGAVTPYGLVGEKANYRGWEPVGQAVTGMHLRNGAPDRPQPARFPLCDLGTGHLFAFSLLLGLWVQRRTGRGQLAQTSLMQAGAYHQACSMIAFEGQTRSDPIRPGGRGVAAHNRLYRAMDGWIYVRAQSLEELENVDGINNACISPDPDAKLEAAFKAQSCDAWIDALDRAGIAAHKLITVEEVMESAAARAQDLSVERLHRGVGLVRSVGIVARFSGTPLEARLPAPPPGDDTLSVLSALYGAEKAQNLIQTGVAAERLPDGEMLVW